MISAMVDGELDETDADHLIKALRSDPQLRERWGRYHLASDALKNQLPDYIDVNFASRVSAALEAEPAILVPQAPSAAPRWIKRAAGFAVAASVAAVAVLSLQSVPQPGSGTVNPQIATAQPAPQAVQSVGYRPGAQPAAAVAVAAQQQQWISDPQLKEFLVNHSEYSAGAGMRGVLPYARIVGHRMPSDR